MGDKNHLLSVKKKMTAQGQAISLHNREKTASEGFTMRGDMSKQTGYKNDFYRGAQRNTGKARLC